MKKYISIIAVLSLLVIGCSEQLSVNSPFDKMITEEPDWIELPSTEANGISVMNMAVFQTSKEINGKNGGKININEKYSGGPFGEIKVKAELNFPKGAFSDVKLITMIIDTQFGLATFSPHSLFDKDVIYNAEFTGLDLSGINVNNVDFVYQAENGSYEYIERSKIEVDLNTGKLKVRDAKLPHFSRYGFVNKTQ